MHIALACCRVGCAGTRFVSGVNRRLGHQKCKEGGLGVVVESTDQSPNETHFGSTGPSTPDGFQPQTPPDAHDSKPRTIMDAQLLLMSFTPAPRVTSAAATTAAFAKFPSPASTLAASSTLCQRIHGTGCIAAYDFRFAGDPRVPAISVHSSWLPSRCGHVDRCQSLKQCKGTRTSWQPGARRCPPIFDGTGRVSRPRHVLSSASRQHTHYCFLTSTSD
jgi:hypothetical protein